MCVLRSMMSRTRKTEVSNGFVQGKRHSRPHRDANMAATVGQVLGFRMLCTCSAQTGALLSTHSMNMAVTGSFEVG